MDTYAPALVKLSAAISMFLSGGFLCSSALGIRAILQARNPTIMVRQWQAMYDIGLVAGPPLMISALVSSATASYLYGQRYPASEFVQNTRALTALVGGVITMTAAPWTLIGMANTNNTLINLNTKATSTSMSETEKSGVEGLILNWRTLNYLRSVIPFVGGVISLVAL